jgi:hypothetical protein
VAYQKFPATRLPIFAIVALKALDANFCYDACIRFSRLRESRVQLLVVDRHIVTEHQGVRRQLRGRTTPRASYRSQAQRLSDRPEFQE